MRSVEGCAASLKRCGIVVLAIRESSGYDGEIDLSDGRTLRVVEGKIQTEKTR